MSTMLPDNFGELLEPGLKEVYGIEYKEFAEQYRTLFTVANSMKASEHGLSLSGLGLAPEKDHGDSIHFADMTQGFKHSLTHTTYGLGYVVARELAEDQMYDVMKSWSRALARSIKGTVETIAGNVYNNAFDNGYLGADNLELCSTLHLLEGGGTYQNEPTDAADLSEESMRQALTDIAAFTDGAGLKINAQAKMLIVPPALDFVADKLLGSNQEPESANNAKNPLKGRMPYKVCNYLDDADAWFIRTDVEPGMVLYWRRMPDFRMDNDTDSENAKYKATFRLSAGWFDPRGLYGSPGAA